MCSDDVVSRIDHAKQERHAVGTATEGHKMESVRCQQSMLRDEIGNFIFHFSLLTFHST